MKFFRLSLLIVYLIFLGCDTEEDIIPEPGYLNFIDQTFEIPENPAYLELINTLNFESNQAVTFSIESASHPDAINLSETTGAIKVNIPTLFNFEENPVMVFRIKSVTSGSQSTANITINLIDIEFEQRYSGHVTLLTQEQVDTFGVNNYAEITGGLYIGKTLEPNETKITSLATLAALKKVNSNLVIRDTEVLSSLDGLDALEFIGGKFEVFSNEKLQNASSLSNLEIIGSFVIANNAVLEDISGFQNIKINTQLRIINNDALVSIGGFNSTKNLWGLLIEGNDRLQNIVGLEGVKKVNAYTIFRNNENLLSLETLSGLDTIIGDLRLENNNALSDINFVNLQSVDNLIISDNDVLSDFCSVTSVVTANGIQGGYSVSGNLFNPSIGDILAGDCSL